MTATLAFVLAVYQLIAHGLDGLVLALVLDAARTPVSSGECMPTDGVSR